jgi:hypothetical protein
MTNERYRDDEYVDAKVIVTIPPLRRAPASEAQSGTFTRKDFEDALDKTSRPRQKPDRAS